MKYDGSPPCGTCPYRRRAKPNYWKDVEFANVVDAEIHPIGGVFACHCEPKRFSEKDLQRFNATKSLPADVKICAGWLVDQIRRGLPSKSLYADLTTVGGFRDRDPSLLDDLQKLYAMSLEDPDVMNLLETLERNVPEEAERFSKWLLVKNYSGVNPRLSETEREADIERWKKLIEWSDAEQIRVLFLPNRSR